MEFCHMANEICGFEIGGQSVVFGGVAELFTDKRARAPRILAQHLERPSADVMEADDHAQHRGLARTIGPEQPSDAREDVEGDIGECNERLVDL